MSFNLSICTTFVSKAVCECRQNLNQMIQHTASNRCLQEKSVRTWDSIDTVICMCDGRDESAAPYYYAMLCTLRHDPQAPVDRQAATSLGSPV